LDFAREFGPILVRRIRIDPPPGTATEEDVVRINDQENRLYELVDGVLVEKVMSYTESFLAGYILTLLNVFVLPRKLGIVAGADGMMRLAPQLVRIPDVSFIRRDRLPDGRLPRQPIAPLAPNLAVEVLSPSNTTREMDRKLEEYFAAGVQLVWYVDPAARTVTVYTAPTQRVVLRENDTLDGGTVLPGFTLPLAQLFAEPGEQVIGPIIPPQA
jgi:Uma2 family endonuclease